MNLREPDHMPSAFDFTRFLASSITFMESLDDVSVYLDNKCLARLVKDVGVPKTFPLPQTLRRTSESKIMEVKGISSRRELPPSLNFPRQAHQVFPEIHIKADVMRWVYFVPPQRKKPTALQPKPKAPSSGLGGLFATSLGNFFSHSPRRGVSPLPEPAPPPPEVDKTEVLKSSITLAVYTADAHTSLSKKQGADLERSMKKRPPQELKYKLIYTGKDAYDASVKEDGASDVKSVFQSLRADLEG
jgi:hypothetical protein